MADAVSAPAPTAKKQKTFIVKPAKCIGCGTCEMTCAFYHQVNVGGRAMPGQTRIRVLHYSEDDHVPMVCYQCDHAACVEACRFDALARNAATNAVEVNYEACTRCGMCIAACPFGAMVNAPGIEAPVKCDLCGGDPQCAKFCPTQALSFK
jgi:carbon-monoxide dehydrogenase iron sulfur subunit